MSLTNQNIPGKNTPGKHEHPLPQEISNEEKKKTDKAHNEAEKDMENDVDFSAHSPNDDLDEGESARLGEDLGNII
jgi:nitric oxide reductase activation protein